MKCRSEDGHAHHRADGAEHGADDQQAGCRRNGRKHRLGRDLGAEQTAREAADEHQEPVSADDRTGHGGVDPEVGGHEEVGEVGNTHLDADVDEDRYRAQDEVAERQRAVLVLLGGLSFVRANGSGISITSITTKASAKMPMAMNRAGAALLIVACAAFP